jgi:hypothetical protein
MDAIKNNSGVRSASGGKIQNKENIENTKFKYKISLELPSNLASKLSKSIVARFNDIEKHEYAGRATMLDGSERDSWIHYGNYGDESIIIEISYRWIDPHFLCFSLWDMDKKDSKYFYNSLFVNQVLDEAYNKNEKVWEMFTAPCLITIGTVINDPETFLPSKSILGKIAKMAKAMPNWNFWDSYKIGDYKKAVYWLRVMEKEHNDKGKMFLSAIEAWCYFLNKENEKSIKLFLKTASDFHDAKMEMYCDLCLYFAIEASMQICEIQNRIQVLEKVAKNIPDLSLAQRKYIFDILKISAVSVYIGVAVCCRSIIESTLKDILVETYKVPVRTLIKDCKKAGVLTGRTSSGMY